MVSHEHTSSNMKAVTRCTAHSAESLSKTTYK